VTVLALTLMSDLSTRTGVTLVALPALFIVVPGDTLSAAAGELLGGRLTTGTIRLIFAFFTLGLIVIGIVAATGLAGHGEVLVETLPPAELPLAIVLVGWMVFSVGLVLAFNAEAPVLLWLVPSVAGTYRLQQGATRLGGTVTGTLVAGMALGAYVGGVGIRGRPPCSAVTW